MEQVKWASPVTYGASKFEVMTEEFHPRLIAVVNTFDDASLISAAPELLAALETIVNAWEEGRVFSDKMNEIGNARAALAKAKGA